MRVWKQRCARQKMTWYGMRRLSGLNTRLRSYGKLRKYIYAMRWEVDAFSPKECFRELRRNQKISDADTEVALQMADDRNEIIHTYNEKFADEVYVKIKKDYSKLMKVMGKILRV